MFGAIFSRSHLYFGSCISFPACNLHRFGCSRKCWLTSMDKSVVCKLSHYPNKWWKSPALWRGLVRVTPAPGVANTFSERFTLFVRIKDMKEPLNRYGAAPSGSRIIIYREWNTIFERKLKTLILEALHEERLKKRVSTAVRAAMADADAKHCADVASPPYRARGWSPEGLNPLARSGARSIRRIRLCG
jgi:hypothetical protein